MRSIDLYDIKKYKKIYAFLIGFLIFVLLIKVFGIKFFLFDLVFDRKKYQISADNLGNIMLKLVIANLKNIVIIFLLLRLKHGRIYKYIVVCLTTLILMFVFINIFLAAGTIGDLLSMSILYLPKYVNIYIYIITQEKLEELTETYNRSNKFIEEMKAFLKIVIVIMSVSIIISGLQAVLSLIAI